MAYRIETVEHHEAAKKAASDRNHSRSVRQLDVSDCALSTWGDSTMQDFHRTAIGYLQNGEEIGIDGPAAMQSILMRDGEEIDARIIETKYGRCWILGDAEEAKCGRKFIPKKAWSSRRSTVQEKLGLEEGKKLVAIDRELGTSCAGMGCPVSFYPCKNGQSLNG